MRQWLQIGYKNIAADVTISSHRELTYMATIHKINGKKGTSYRITVSHGFDAHGARKRVVRTIHAADLEAKTEPARDREAARIAAEIETEIRTGRKSSDIRTDKIYLADMIPQWESWMEKRLAAGTIAPATIRYYRRDWYLYCAEFFRDMTLDQITKETGRDFINYLKLDKKYSRKSITHALTVIGSVYTFLTEIKHIPAENPFIGLKIPRGKHEKKAARSLSDDEADLFLEILQIASQKWRLFFLIMLTTGARPAEVLALRWNDFCQKNGVQVILIDEAVIAQKDTGWTIGKPKTEASVRYVYQSDILQADLEAHRKAEQQLLKKSQQQMRHTLLFHGKDPEKCHSGNAPCDRLRSLIQRWNKQIERQLLAEKDKEKRAALQEKLIEKTRAYDLRHTYATLEIGAGMPANVLAKKLGHVNLQMINSTYVHPMEDAQMSENYFGKNKKADSAASENLKKIGEEIAKLSEDDLEKLEEILTRIKQKS